MRGEWREFKKELEKGRKTNLEEPPERGDTRTVRGVKHKGSNSEENEIKKWKGLARMWKQWKTDKGDPRYVKLESLRKNWNKGTKHI